MSDKKLVRMPELVDQRITKISNLFEVPKTKGFIIQEKFLFGEFQVKGIKRNKNKKIYQFEIEI